jgi:hypothetical protein
MPIRLAYVDPDSFPVPSGWTAVGFLGGAVVLAYDDGRRPHAVVDGVPAPLDPADVNPSLAEAVEAAALRVWPDGWTHAVSDVFKVNRRSLARDRLASVALPPAVMKVLGSISDSPDADGLGRIMSAMAWYADAYGEGSAWPDRVETAAQASANVVSALMDARRGKPLRPQGEG